jgi:hypothetical protein
MLPSARNPSDAAWLPAWMAGRSEREFLWVITAVALAIRLYLVFTTFCIAADGVAYLAMAQQFAAHEPARALGSVFSPFYPWLIAQLHRVVPSWELAGSLISAMFGTATIPLLYLLIAEVFERRDLAGAGAALAAIHPLMAEYSASVRTEAGFICLMVASTYLFVASIRSRRSAKFARSGLVGGLAYLYRVEAIGLLMVCVAFLLLGSALWKAWHFKAASRWALSFALPFLIVASPYLIYLRVSTGHWSVGRELSAAMAFGIAEVVEDKKSWQITGLQGGTSIIAPLLAAPRAYLWKVAYDLAMSLYAFPIALGPLLSVFLLIGIWIRRRNLIGSWSEAMLAAMVCFYFGGFVLSYTGTRFMLHLIPYTFGWVAIGLEACAYWLAHPRSTRPIRIPESALAIAVGLAMLASTLIPIGYDLRGLRYAGQDIARMDPSKPGVVSRDPRVAFYADGRFIELPTSPEPGLCKWLAGESNASYLMVSRREERSLGDLPAARCLRLIKRYPRAGGSYYDLFQISRN